MMHLPYRRFAPFCGGLLLAVTGTIASAAPNVETPPVTLAAAGTSDYTIVLPVAAR